MYCVTTDVFAIIGNRSATFFEMGEWKKCLDDIDGREKILTIA